MLPAVMSAYKQQLSPDQISNASQAAADLASLTHLVYGLQEDIPGTEWRAYL